MISGLVVQPAKRYVYLRWLLLATVILLPLQSLKGWASVMMIPLLLAAIPLLLLARTGANRLATTAYPKIVFYSSWLQVVLIGLFYISTVSWGDTNEVLLLGFVPATTHDLATHALNASATVFFWLAIIGSALQVFVLSRTQPPKEAQ